jgi:hypothetical protein
MNPHCKKICHRVFLLIRQSNEVVLEVSATAVFILPGGLEQ